MLRSSTHKGLMRESDTVVEEDERGLHCIPVNYTVKNYSFI